MNHRLLLVFHQHIFFIEIYNNLSINWWYHFLFFSVICTNVALFSSLWWLSDATVWIKAKGRSSTLHASANTKFRAEILESQISLAWGPTKARHGAQFKWSTSQNMVSKSQVCVCTLEMKVELREWIWYLNFNFKV